MYLKIMSCNFLFSTSTSIVTPHPPPHSFTTRRSSDLNPPLLPQSEGSTFATEISLLDHITQICSHLGRERYRGRGRDRKSTRLNSSHVAISYSVFFLDNK